MSQAESHNIHEKEVFFENKMAGVVLSGTLTLPKEKGKFPAVILIAGMGPKDRDATFGNFKLFKILAEYLTRQGVAVLRYDKRGVGKSTGTFDMTLTSQDFANDVNAALQFLINCDQIDTERIGLLGHSEGGMIATMVAVHSSDLSFVVLFGAVAQTSRDALVEQTVLQLRADGASPEMIQADAQFRKKFLTTIIENAGKDTIEKILLREFEEYWNNLSDNLKAESETLAFAFSKTKIEQRVAMYYSPWYLFFLNYRPFDDLKKIKIPLLAVYGELDFITSSSLCASLINQAMAEARNNNYQMINLPTLNHQFQKCTTGAVAEYGLLDGSIAPEALEVVSDWIVRQTE